MVVTGEERGDGGGGGGLRLPKRKFIGNISPRTPVLEKFRRLSRLLATFITREVYTYIHLRWITHLVDSPPSQGHLVLREARQKLSNLIHNRKESKKTLDFTSLGQCPFPPF